MGRNNRSNKESHQEEIPSEKGRETKSRMEMAQRERDITRIKSQRDRGGTEAGTRRRVEKKDGKLADYSHIKAATGIVVPEVKKVLLDRKRIEAERSVHRTGIIYPSEMAKSNWCPRATYYRMSGRPQPEGSTSFALENVFAEGNAIHAKWQRWMADTGLLWGDWRCSRCGVAVTTCTKPDAMGCVGIDWTDFGQQTLYLDAIDQTVTPKQFPHDWRYKEVTLRSQTHRVSGHADGALLKHNCLVELKSVGVGSLRFEAPNLLEQNTYDISGKKVIDIDGLWKNLHRPLLSHVRQGNIYLWMAKEMGLPFDSIVFLYEFKANQQVKEFQISMSDDILNPMLDTASQVEYALSVGIAPACPWAGCGQCEAYEKEEKDAKKKGSSVSPDA